MLATQGLEGKALWQKQNNGILEPVAVAIRYLKNDAEKKYLFGKLELLNGGLGIGTFLNTSLWETNPILL